MVLVGALQISCPHSFRNNSCTCFDKILLFPVSVLMHPKIVVMELDYFWGFSVILLVFRYITLTLTLNYTNVNITTSFSYNLLKQYIISWLCPNFIFCCVKFSCFNFDTVHMELLICLNLIQFNCFPNTPNLAWQVLFLQPKQSIVFPSPPTFYWDTIYRKATNQA